MVVQVVVRSVAGGGRVSDMVDQTRLRFMKEFSWYRVTELPF